MPARTRILPRAPLLGLLLLAPTCVLDAEIIGETITTGTSAASDGGATQPNDSDPGASSTSAGPVPGAYGSDGPDLCE